jgi:hypothetical protein
MLPAPLAIVVHPNLEEQFELQRNVRDATIQWPATRSQFAQLDANLVGLYRKRLDRILDIRVPLEQSNQQSASKLLGRHRLNTLAVSVYTALSESGPIYY